MTKRLWVAVAAGAAIASLPGTAMAQEARDTRVRVGLGAQVQPEYPGADDSEILPLIDVDIARGSDPFRFEAPDDSFAIPVFTKEGFAFGPAANYQTSRRDRDVGAPVGKVKATLELGAYAEYYVAESVRLRAEALKGVNGHKGFIGSVGADAVWRDGDKYVFSVGPRVLLSDSRYQRAYFGVDSTASLLTGLPTYRPDGGIHGVALASGLSYQFSSRFGLFGYGRFERLVGDAGKSPIVREFGSRSQFSGGLGLSYTFTLNR